MEIVTFRILSIFFFYICQLNRENFRDLEEGRAMDVRGLSPWMTQWRATTPRTDLHCTVMWGVVSQKCAIQISCWENKIYCGPPAAHWIYHCVCAKATLPMGCSQPMTEPVGDRDSGPFWQDIGFLQQVSLTPLAGLNLSGNYSEVQGSSCLICIVVWKLSSPPLAPSYLSSYFPPRLH